MTDPVSQWQYVLDQVKSHQRIISVMDKVRQTDETTEHVAIRLTQERIAIGKILATYGYKRDMFDETYRNTNIVEAIWNLLYLSDKADLP